MMNRIVTLILCIAAAVTAFAATSQKYEILQKAKDGDAAAQNEVGSWCYNGTNGKKVNYTEALQWWAKAAKQGNVEQWATWVCATATATAPSATR